MQYYTSLFLTALSASSALAAPLRSRGSGTTTTDNEVRVALTNSRLELGSQNVFTDGQREQQTPSQSGPFLTVELRLGADVGNPDQRCQILDNDGNPIIVLRGENRDITFADGDKGEWTLETPSEVSAIICDPTFEKGIPDDTDNDKKDLDTTVSVLLQDIGAELGATTNFDAVEQRIASRPTASTGPFTTVTLTVGKDAQQDLRCQLLDNAGSPITLARNGNVDTTFADGDAGSWTFLDPEKSEVALIVCDPAFQKASAN